MTTLQHMVQDFFASRDEGQGLAEYALSLIHI